MAMWQIFPIPALEDNYIWVIHQAQNAIIVDPAQAEPVLAFLAKYNLTLKAILLTHNHSDHTDGVIELLQYYPNIPIYGSEEVNVFANNIVADGEQFSLLGQNINVIGSAGHTEKHISYLFGKNDLFCGDALFSGGCGRVFTGDYAAQYQTLQRFNCLPDEVKIYPAHEYTQNNLQFAAKTLPSSDKLLAYQAHINALRNKNMPSLPSTIGIEKQINPFLRAKTLEEFTLLRKQKDCS